MSYRYVELALIFFLFWFYTPKQLAQYSKATLVFSIVWDELSSPVYESHQNDSLKLVKGQNDSQLTQKFNR